MRDPVPAMPRAATDPAELSEAPPDQADAGGCAVNTGVPRRVFGGNAAPSLRPLPDNARENAAP